MLSSRRVLAAASLAALALASTSVAAASARTTTPPKVTVKVTLVGTTLRRATTAEFKITRTPSTAKILTRLDAGRWAATTKLVKTVSGLKPGKHTFFVEAVVGTTRKIASAQVWVDNQAPHVPVANTGSSNWTSNSPRQVSIGTVTDAGLAGGVKYLYRKSVNGAGYGAAVTLSGRSFAVASEGLTAIQVAAKDALGNTSAWSTVKLVRLDTIAPAAPSVAGLPSGATSSDVTLTASDVDDLHGSGIAGYRWLVTMNGGEPSETAGDQLDLSTEGAYDVVVRAIDNAGNESADASLTVVIDETAPSVPTISGGPGGSWTDEDVTLTATSVDSGSGVAGYQWSYSQDGTPKTATGPTLTLSADASYDVQVQAIDNAGNESGSSDPSSFGIDQTAPSTPGLTGTHENEWVNFTTSVTPSGSTDTGGSGLNGYDCYDSVNGAPAVQIGWVADGYTLNDIGFDTDGDGVLASGTHIVTCQAIDTAGNTSAMSNSVTVKIDDTPPTFTLSYPGNPIDCSAVAPFEIDVANPADSQSGFNTYSWSVTDSDNQVTTGEDTPMVLSSPGVYTVDVTGEDNAGNTSTHEQTFCVGS